MVGISGRWPGFWVGWCNIILKTSDSNGEAMKVHHNAAVDHLSIDFTDEVEARAIYEDGVIVRYNKSGHVIGIDITDSMRMFARADFMTLQEACDFLGISESTMRRRVRAGEIAYVKEGNRYRFRKADIARLAN